LIWRGLVFVALTGLLFAAKKNTPPVVDKPFAPLEAEWTMQVPEGSWCRFLPGSRIFGSRFALYDLKVDPLQKKDISKQRTEVTNRLKKKLLTLYNDVMADAPETGPQNEPTQHMLSRRHGVALRIHFSTLHSEGFTVSAEF